MTHSRTIRILFVGSMLVASVGTVGLSLWLLWPAWIEYRDLAEFERLVGPLPRAGETDVIKESLPDDYLAWDDFGEWEYVTYRRDALFYVICFRTENTVDRTRCVQVYRIQAPRDSYDGRTKLAAYYAQTPGDPTAAAAGDFVAQLCGDSDAAQGLQYRLIYSDPPAPAITTHTEVK